MRIFGLAFVIALSLCGHAGAQSTPNSPATLLTDFVCPGATCQTTCNGPAGTLTVSAKSVKVFQYVPHARRLWLLADGQVYVLGDNDRCHFGGATTISFARPPVQTVPLNPPQPQCTCIGNQCTPPGCRRQ
jgi:hypothetical protein